MISIDDRKALRRANVARLLDQFGQTKLADLTGIPSAMLYQFGKAKGKSKRNVNDRHARAIEESVGYEVGWLDINHGATTQAAAPTKSAKVDNWPFSFSRARWDRLRPAQRKQIEEDVERMLRLCEGGTADPREKSRAARQAK